jgi:hypothetical protein
LPCGIPLASIHWRSLVFRVPAGGFASGFFSGVASE